MRRVCPIIARLSPRAREKRENAARSHVECRHGRHDTSTGRGDNFTQRSSDVKFMIIAPASDLRKSELHVGISPPCCFARLRQDLSASPDYRRHRA